MDHSIHGFVASNKISDLPDLLALELSFKPAALFRQGLIQLGEISADLLDPLTNRSLLSLGVVKCRACSRKSGSSNARTTDRLGIKRLRPLAFLFSKVR